MKTKDYKIKVKLTNSQIDFLKRARLENETLSECAVRLMGDSHRRLVQKKITQAKDKKNLN